MNCSRCGNELAGHLLVSDGELGDGTPVVRVDSTPDRNWIVCDSCNVLLCHKCCQYPESGYCDTCITKYDLHDYLVSAGLIHERGGCGCL
jgi:hypothetical protein